MSTKRRIAACLLGAAVSCLLPLPASAAGTITVDTLPPTPGVPLLIDDEQVVTDSAGQASAVVADENDATVEPATRYSRIRPGVRSKVADIEGSGSTRTLRLDLEYRTAFTFATVDGEPVANDQVGSVTLRGSTGKVTSIKPTKAVWLHGMRIARPSGVPEPKDIWWNVDDVKVRGTTVVNRSQQRFEPSNMPDPDRTVSVELLFFDASVRVRDAFFGSPVDGELIVEYPDGSTERHTLDADGAVSLGDVPRGQYEMAVEGAGLRIPRPMTITRDLDDELRFYSWLDVGLAATFILLFLWGLLAVGARRRRSQRRAARRASIARQSTGLRSTSPTTNDERDRWLGVE